jgi:hypothetical protein
MEFARLSLAERIERCRSFSTPYRLSDGKKFRLKHVDPDDTGDLTSEDKPQAKEALGLGVEVLAQLQERLYAQDRWAILLIFQAMDAAGKDGAIKHVMSGVNPQGCQVFSFKQLRPLSDRTPSTRPCWKQLMSTAITESRKPGSNKMSRKLTGCWSDCRNWESASTM